MSKPDSSVYLDDRTYGAGFTAIDSPQPSWSTLQRELNPVAHPVIDVDARRVQCRLAGTVFKRDREVDLEFSVTRRSRIVGNHRRTALAVRPARRHGTNRKPNR